MFTVMIMIPMIFIGLVLGAVCLRLANIPISWPSVVAFALIGGLMGFATMVIWSLIFTNSEGQLETTLGVLGMFLVAGGLAVISGLYASVNVTKVNRSHDK